MTHLDLLRFLYNTLLTEFRRGVGVAQKSTRLLLSLLFAGPCFSFTLQHHRDFHILILNQLIKLRAYVNVAYESRELLN